MTAASKETGKQPDPDALCEGRTGMPPNYPGDSGDTFEVLIERSKSMSATDVTIKRNEVVLLSFAIKGALVLQSQRDPVKLTFVQ